MRILILANNDIGLYRFRKELIAELLKDHAVFISLPNGELVDPLVEMGCTFYDTPIDRRGINPLTDLKLLYGYKRMIEEVKPDLVITYTIKPNIYGGFVCRWKKIPYAVNITGLGTAFEREDLLQQTVTLMYRTALKKARVVFTENSSIRDVLLQKRIASKEQLCVLNGAGVNLQDFPLLAYPQNEEFCFLFIGRVMKEKGVDELFEAVRSLNREGKRCALHLVGFSEENYQKEVRKGCSEGWLYDHGFQKDVRPFIADADCFVLPSWHEGMANTNLECASSGRPVITSDIPGCREAVLDGATGLLCRPRNAESLKKAMGRMLAMPAGERSRMGLAGRRHMEETFDKKVIVKETISRLFS